MYHFLSVLISYVTFHDNLISNVKFHKDIYFKQSNRVLFQHVLKLKFTFYYFFIFYVIRPHLRHNKKYLFWCILAHPTVL